MSKKPAKTGIVCPTCGADDSEEYLSKIATRRYKVFVCRNCATMVEEKQKDGGEDDKK